MTLTIDSIRERFRRTAEPPVPTTPAVYSTWSEVSKPTKPELLWSSIYADTYKPGYTAFTATPYYRRTYADVPPKSNTEIFRDAGRYIEEHGWTQGQYEAADGSVCLVGAIMAVANAEDTGRVIAYLYWKVGGSPVMWNDTVGRTKDEVLSLLSMLAGRRELMYTIDKELELTPA